MSNLELEIINRSIDLIKKCKTKENLRDVFWKSIVSLDINFSHPIKILIINAPCYGFGDVMFAMKLSQYITEWYSNVEVFVATTLPKAFITLGMNEKYLYQLDIGQSKNNTQCRRFRLLKIKNMNNRIVKPNADLYFVAPLQADHIPNRKDIKTLLPKSNYLNTKIFSEYNCLNPALYDFPLGIGKGNLGIFLTSPKIENISDIIEQPYAVTYLLNSNRPEICLKSFIEMITTKYKYNKFQIVIQPWFADFLIANFEKFRINSHYKNIRVIYKNSDLTISETILYGKSSWPELIFRGDIYPIPNIKMLNLIRNSVKDILVTGDQSITDVLSCCSSKNIYYQILPWKESFARQLAKRLPNEYLQRKKTSCGSLESINYESNYLKFIDEWDFRKNSKYMLDAMINFSSLLYSMKKLKKFYKQISEAKTLASAKKIAKK